MIYNAQNFITNFVKSIEDLKSDNLEDLESYYSLNCSFIDPFHKIFGSSKIIKMYKNMFKSLDNPKFEIVHSIEKKNIVIFKWLFRFSLNSKTSEIIIPGVTWIELNNENLIQKQEDYWDSCELFNKFVFFKHPLLWLKRRIAKI